MSNARPEPHFSLGGGGGSSGDVTALIEGIAAADCTGLAPVAPGAQSAVAIDTVGRLIVVAIGNVAADDPDLCNPVKIGVRATADSTVGQPAVAVNDRQNVAADLFGRLIVMAQGNVANDAPDAGFPLKDGGYAEDQAPATVSAVADRVNAYFDRQGRQQTNMEKAIAGENLVLNVLRVVRGKLAVEQESWQSTVLGAAGVGVTGQVIKGAAGRLGRIQIINTTAVGVYVILHDSTAFATIGAGLIKWRGFVPAIAGVVPGVLDMDFSSDDGLYFEIGISVVTSVAVDSVSTSQLIFGNTLFV